MASNAQEERLIDAAERLRAMRTREVSQYAVPDYLVEGWQRTLRDAADSEEGVAPPAWIDDLWRGRVSAWFFDIADRFGIEREVVTVTLSCLDRYLAGRAVDRCAAHVAAVTAFCLAVKLSSAPPAHRRVLSFLVGASGGYFRVEQITAMEKCLLDALDWRVHPPTPLAFCRDFMQFLSEKMTPLAHHEVSEFAEFMTELSVGDYWFATRRPSAVALAALLNALEIQRSKGVGLRCADELLRRVGVDFVRDAGVMECRARLHDLLRMAEEDRHAVATVGLFAADAPDEDASAALPAPNTVQEAVEADAPLVAPARVVSPEIALPDRPSHSCNNMTRSFTLSSPAKKVWKNLSSELNKEDLPSHPSPPCDKTTRSFTRSAQAKRARKNLNSELTKEDLPGRPSHSCNKRTRSVTRSAQAKRARKNLSSELIKEDHI